MIVSFDFEFSDEMTMIGVIMCHRLSLPPLWRLSGSMKGKDRLAIYRYLRYQLGQHHRQRGCIWGSLQKYPC